MENIKTPADKPIKKINTIYDKLNFIQQKLEAKKNQYNKFGNFYYRSCEDILESAKPLLGDLVLLLEDKVVKLGDRYYIKAIAKITDGQTTIENTAYAREVLSKTKMDESQITGAASSYARKYALNGLFCIDDEKDADTKDNSKKEEVEENKTEEKTQRDYSTLPKAEGKFCDICGKQGVINPKTNNAFCSDYKIHAEKGEKWSIVNEQVKEFLSTMPEPDQPIKRGKKVKQFN